MTDIVVPTLGESVTEATVSQWLKTAGDTVAADEAIVELETDKVSLEVNSPVAGVVVGLLAEVGATVEVGAPLAKVETDAAAVPTAPAKSEAAPATAPVAAADADADPGPAVRKMLTENDLDASRIPASGRNGRLTKEDVLKHLESGGAKAAPAPAAPPPAAPPPAAPPPAATAPAAPTAPVQAFTSEGLQEKPVDPRGEERVKMTKLRKTIATRLKQAQDTAAMLTTFNEVDMGPLLAARKQYRDPFEKKHNVRLGFLSFFMKACVQALKEIPAVNAEIYGDQLIYKNYYDISVAVGTPRGLVVPVVKDCDKKSFAELESTVADMAKRARDGKLSIAEIMGGTFTITNGGVYGSLLSTPILNLPQSGILGMHKIQKRPMVDGDEIGIRDMMYLALSYDHRIVDGREAVTFLVRVKECLEDPQRLLIGV